MPPGVDPFLACGRNEIERRVNAGRFRRNFDMKRPAILQVAPPLERLAIEEKLQSRKVFDGAGGTVLARNPFWVVERQRARRSRDLHAHVKYFARSFGRIQADGDARGGGRNRVAGNQENQNKKTSAGEALHGPAFLLNRFSTGNIPACLDNRHELRAVQSDANQVMRKVNLQSAQKSADGPQTKTL